MYEDCIPLGETALKKTYERISRKCKKHISCDITSSWCINNFMKKSIIWEINNSLSSCKWCLLVHIPTSWREHRVEGISCELNGCCYLATQFNNPVRSVLVVFKQSHHTHTHWMQRSTYSEWRSCKTISALHNMMSFTVKLAFSAWFWQCDKHDHMCTKTYKPCRPVWQLVIGRRLPGKQRRSGRSWPQVRRPQEPVASGMPCWSESGAVWWKREMGEGRRGQTQAWKIKGEWWAISLLEICAWKKAKLKQRKSGLWTRDYETT